MKDARSHADRNRAAVARKALRACIRATRTLKSIDVTTVDADSALNIKASIDALDRTEKAFAKARTDAELLSAIYLAMTLSDSLAEDRTTVELAH